MIRHKFREWLKRYLPAEIAGTVTAVGAASLAQALNYHPVVVAYAGSLGEAIGFYSTTLILNLYIVRKRYRIEDRKFTIEDIISVIIRIVVEFGPAGIVDGLFLRPFFMHIFPILLQNFTLGILAGKFVGDITFYLLVILSYERKKKFDKDKILRNGLPKSHKGSKQV